MTRKPDTTTKTQKEGIGKRTEISKSPSMLPLLLCCPEQNVWNHHDLEPDKITRFEQKSTVEELLTADFSVDLLGCSA